MLRLSPCRSPRLSSAGAARTTRGAGGGKITDAFGVAPAQGGFPFAADSFRKRTSTRDNYLQRDHLCAPKPPQNSTITVLLPGVSRPDSDPPSERRPCTTGNGHQWSPDGHQARRAAVPGELGARRAAWRWVAILGRVRSSWAERPLVVPSCEEAVLCAARRPDRQAGLSPLDFRSDPFRVCFRQMRLERRPA